MVLFLVLSVILPGGLKTYGLTMNVNYQITGTVYLPDDKAVSKNTKVGIFNSNWSYVGSVTTDNGGAFKVIGLTKGKTYKLIANSDGSGSYVYSKETVVTIGNMPINVKLTLMNTQLKLGVKYGQSMLKGTQLSNYELLINNYFTGESVKDVFPSFSTKTGLLLLGGLSDGTYYIEVMPAVGANYTALAQKVSIEGNSLKVNDTPIMGAEYDITLRDAQLTGTATPNSIVGVFKVGEPAINTLTTLTYVGSVIARSNGKFIVGGLENNTKYTLVSDYNGAKKYLAGGVINVDTNGKLNSNTVVISLIKMDLNMPTVGDYTALTTYNKSVTGKVIGTDTDGDTLTYSKSTNPYHGTVSVKPDGSWTYKPNSYYSGMDSFKVKVDDGKGGIATSTISIIVQR